MGQRLRVKCWSNGSTRPTGAGYGVRLSPTDRDRHFDRDWQEVVVDLEGTRHIARVPLSASFWRGCPELRSAAIGRWLLDKGLAPWPTGSPPALWLEITGPQTLQLSQSTQASIDADPVGRPRRRA